MGNMEWLKAVEVTLFEWFNIVEIEFIKLIKFIEWEKISEFMGKNLIPILLVIIGFYIYRSLAKNSSDQAITLKLIEKRITVYDEMAPKLHEIQQYMTRAGDWKNISPKTVLKNKRSIDKLFYANLPYWSLAFIDSYDSYFDECFQTNNGSSKGAKIKADIIKYQNLKNWDKKLLPMFIDNKSNEYNIHKKYKKLNHELLRGSLSN